MQVNSSLEFQDFSDEVALRIFSYLHPRALFASSQVCRDWLRLLDDLEIWKYYNEPIASTWPYAKKVETMSNRDYYKKYMAGNRIRDIFVLNDRIYGACDQDIVMWNPSGKKFEVTHYKTDHSDVMTRVFLYYHPQTMQTTMLTGSADRTVKIWNLQKDNTFKLMHTLKGHEKTITAVHMCDKRIFTGSADSKIMVWEIDRSKEEVNCVATLEAHDGTITCFQVESHENQKYTLYSGSSRTIKVWDLNFEAKKCENTHTIDNPEGIVTCLSFTHPFSRALIGGFVNGTIKILKYNKKKELETKILQTGNDPISCLLKPHFKKQFFSGSQNKVKVWDGSNGQNDWQATETKQQNETVASFAFDIKSKPANSKLYVLTHNSSIKIFIKSGTTGHYELTETLHDEEKK